MLLEELCRGEVNERSRTGYREIIGRPAQRGADGNILGCTEIAMLTSVADSQVLIIDTTELHAVQAAEVALSG